MSIRPNVALRIAIVSSIVSCGLVVAGPANADPPGSAASPQNAQQLVGLLSKGFDSESCDPVAIVGKQLAALNCGINADSDGPLGGDYVLYRDDASLQAALPSALGKYQLVPCPGRTDPSPAKWASPSNANQIQGTVACGDDGQQSQVVWTDDSKRLLASVWCFDDIPRLYQWWYDKG